MRVMVADEDMDEDDSPTLLEELKMEIEEDDSSKELDRSSPLEELPS